MLPTRNYKEPIYKHVIVKIINQFFTGVLIYIMPLNNESKLNPLKSKVENKYVDYINGILNLQYILKVLISLLFIIILCSAICFLIVNVIRPNARSRVINIYSQKFCSNDTLHFGVLKSNKDSITVVQFTDNYWQHDTILLIVNRSGAIKDWSNLFNLKSQNSSQDDLIKIITILFSVFTAIFGIFTFIIQQYSGKNSCS